MTFLELVKRLRQEAGIAGTGPSSTTFQTGELKRLVDWVSSSWNDIQIAKPNWLWMNRQFQFTTTAGQREYTPAEAGIATRFSSWMTRTVRIGLNPPNDEVLLEPVSYDEYRSIYMVGPQPQARPVVVSVSPTLNLLLGYAPNDIFTVTGEYQQTPQKLLEDADVPEMPEQYHEAILYLALTKYARFMAANEIYEDAMVNYKRIMQQLQIHQLPGVTPAESMA